MKNRSHLSAPSVITDTMPPTEQVDGKFYESKAAFRRVGRALGLSEVGNEKRRPKRYTSSTPAERRAALERAIAQHKAGRRPRG